MHEFYNGFNYIRDSLFMKNQPNGAIYMKSLKVMCIFFLVMVILNFLTMLDMVGLIFEFGIIAHIISIISNYIPVWVFGTLGIICNIILYNKSFDNRWKIFCVISTCFCVFVCVLNMIFIYILNRI